MSLAAADFFLASRPIPSTAVAPGQDDPLYKYLYRRQVDSLGPGLCFAPVFARWMALPDDGADGTFARTAANMDSITGALEQDRPVMLGLVLQRSGEPGALLWQNHQVLALGPARVLAGEHWPNSVVGIYDPNFPGNDGVILELRAVEVGVMSLPRPLHGEFPLYGIRTTRIAGSRRTPVRGVFELPYVRRTPPSDLK
jgi:hypothetical protein